MNSFEKVTATLRQRETKPWRAHTESLVGGSRSTHEYSRQSFSISLAIFLPARRSQFAFLPLKSCSNCLIWVLVPRCTFAISRPIARRSAYSSRSFGSLSISIGFESGDRRRISQFPNTNWTGQTGSRGLRTALSPSLRMRWLEVPKLRSRKSTASSSFPLSQRARRR